MGERTESQLEVRQPKKVVVEIGPGGVPYPFRIEKNLPDDVIYLGIEGGGKGKDARDANFLNSFRDNGDKALVVGGDGERAPVANESVDEVICNNIFGDAMHFPDPSKLLNEISRMLKPQGKAVLTDTLTASTMLANLGAYESTDPEEIKQDIQRYFDTARIPLRVETINFATDNFKPLKDYVGSKEKILSYDPNSVQIILKKYENFSSPLS